MSKTFYSLGLMSGTSMDGIDASIIQSDGKDSYKTILNDFTEYSPEIYDKLNYLRNKIHKPTDLLELSKDLNLLEKKLTLFHAKFVNKIINQVNFDINFLGFHGQTIFHSADEKISKQLGDGNLLSQIVKKIVIYDFRSNDLKNGGEGAPLTPIFHLLLNKKIKKNNNSFLNIGGISNLTVIKDKDNFFAKDIGPGNCMIDKWIKQNSKISYDKNGDKARKGKVNKIILDQALDIYLNNSINDKKTYDINDFDISFARGLSLEDGAATITEFTAEVLSKKINNNNIFVSGGGRKNKYLLERIEKKINSKINLIDSIGVDGDFVESQAFGYLAIRSYLKLPITFPETTGCSKPLSGGLIAKNF